VNYVSKICSYEVSIDVFSVRYSIFTDPYTCQRVAEYRIGADRTLAAVSPQQQLQVSHLSQRP